MGPPCLGAEHAVLTGAPVPGPGAQHPVAPSASLHPRRPDSAVPSFGLHALHLMASPCASKPLSALSLSITAGVPVSLTKVSSDEGC